MPYKHANGCTCMTLPEFLNDLGKREGKTGGEVMTDIMTDMADDDRRQEQYWKENPDSLFKEFNEEATLIADNDDPSLPIPTSLVKIIKVECHSGFRESKISSTIWVRCKDKKVREVTWWRSSDSGSFYEPPDSDGDVAWGRIIPKEEL